MAEDSQLLVIIFDVNPVWWGLKALQGRAQIARCLDCLLLFVNSYMMLHHENKLAVLASHTSQTKYLYPKREESSQKKDGEDHQKFTAINDTIIEEFKSLMTTKLNESNIRSDSLIAGSMTVALCYINKLHRESRMGEKTRSRILVIKAADDAAAQYMSFMNVIFAAQKHQIVIDSCVLGQDSGLLQQACDMTGGIYMKIPNQESLLQYLLTAFLVNPDLRKQSLTLTSSTEKRSGVDYRAACFCHRSLVDVGFVCSVCLSIFCQFSPICSTCETAFKPPPSLGLKSKRKKRAAHNGRSTT
ncbi:general transcription factor IIH subunit 3-like [Styela clava]|uniref:general transcription factor IIH subunit 3-like n=1 Tax=Styela clava TaxID=7725 RepID=UPI00193AB3DC|nr:general transcription factor IIH subunit 3-like [Styela clava]